MAGFGAAAATAAGFDLTARGKLAFASDGDAVSAGKETKAEHGTTVTYDGKSGFTGAVLLGSDSTYGNGDFSFPAGVAGIAGGGATAGTGGSLNGVYGFTDRGVGNGVVGVNSNSLPVRGTQSLAWPPPRTHSEFGEPIQTAPAFSVNRLIRRTPPLAFTATTRT